MAADFSTKFRLTLAVAPWIHELRFSDCVVATADDADALARALQARYETFDRMLDVVLCLDGFDIKSAARTRFGALRADLVRKYFRYSTRYSGAPLTRVFIATSGVLQNVEGVIYPSRDEAIAALVATRQRDGAPELPPLRR